MTKTHAQKAGTFIGNYPASIGTPIITAIVVWAQSQPQWHWDKGDKQLAVTLLAFTPAIITILKVQGSKFVSWIVSRND